MVAIQCICIFMHTVDLLLIDCRCFKKNTKHGLLPKHVTYAEKLKKMGQSLSTLGYDAVEEGFDTLQKARKKFCFIAFMWNVFKLCLIHLKSNFPTMSILISSKETAQIKSTWLARRKKYVNLSSTGVLTTLFRWKSANANHQKKALAKNR